MPCSCALYLFDFSYRRMTYNTLLSKVRRERKLLVQFFILSIPILAIVACMYVLTYVGAEGNILGFTVLVACILNSSINPYCYILFSATIRKHMPLKRDNVVMFHNISF